MKPPRGVEKIIVRVFGQWTPECRVSAKEITKEYLLTGTMKCPAEGCWKEPSVQHYRDSPQCIAAVRSVNGMASTSQRQNNKGGRPRKQSDQQKETTK